MESGRIGPRRAVFIALFTGLTALSAFVRLPVPWVPVTLQTAAVLLSGVILGARYGALSQAVYVMTGLLGFPVFAQGGGVGYILNPTFGYLAGFVAGAGLCGLLAGDWRVSSNKRLFGAMIAGLGIIYLTGVAYLHWNMSHIQGKDLPFMQLVKIGFFLPLPADLVKIICLLPIIRILKRREHIFPVMR